ncbi:MULTISPECIES: ATP-binding protein [unclassified Halorubrum]|uniref:ATP-binding protein n=1 Tax=unclassified Halorubrum TaxID=2642239 RepID=UPI0010F6B4CC|nr:MULTISPECIES: ATP-binding protein [unclassified Halorubrum]TKX44197.1 PAS domain S-box protein [Halorubrum sp. ARQ200]TKX50895.1 PAS domain S-box protein [Halorubrum sp. ASP121]
MAAKPHARLPPAYDSLRVGIALFDVADGTVESANDRLESLVGYSTAELRGLSVGRYTANTYRFSESEFADRLREAAAGGSPEFTWRIKRRDGELVWVRVSLSPWSGDRGLENDADRRTDGDGERETGARRVLAEVRDISEHYAASRREALFWRVLRHNLRNEANKIIGYTGEILRTTDDDGVREAAADAREAAVGLGGVATSVKEIQQAVSRSEPPRSHRRAAAAARDVVAALEPSYPDAEFVVDERRPMWIHVDAAFDHALRHAVENAVRHADEPDPTVEVTVRPSPNTGRVEIRVVDANPHIPEAEVDALDAFGEVTNTRHGTGVGLFVMKWCIESLGGELEFERRDPRGNVVRLYLPARERPAPSA